MTVDQIAPEIFKAKYILISWSDGLKASPIIDDNELKTYLSDGSMDEGDVLLTVTNAKVVRIKRVPELIVKNQDPKGANK